MTVPSSAVNPSAIHLTLDCFWSQIHLHYVNIDIFLPFNKGSNPYTNFHRRFFSHFYSIQRQTAALFKLTLTNWLTDWLSAFEILTDFHWTICAHARINGRPHWSPIWQINMSVESAHVERCVILYNLLITFHCFNTFECHLFNCCCLFSEVFYCLSIS